MTAYYNEIDPYAAQWLRSLISAGHLPPGDVDERSITEVHPYDVADYDQAHFFAGIGGWPLGLRLAGWPDDGPVWTGSCPCQPFSSASNVRNMRWVDERNLWPIWQKLIFASRPRAIFGEQVAQAADWFDAVCDDLEAMGYAIGAAILPAVSLGFDHARQRIYFAGYAYSDSEPIVTLNEKTCGLSWDHSQSARMAETNGLSGRMGAMRAYGNAVIPQVAAEFIKATLDN